MSGRRHASSFFFFFKFQYMLRHDFLEESELTTFDDYLTQARENPSTSVYRPHSLQAIEILFEKYLSGEYKPEHFYFLVPRRFKRAGRPIVTCEYDPPELKLKINLEQIDLEEVSRNRIHQEIDNLLDLAKPDEEGEVCLLKDAEYSGLNYEDLWRYVDPEPQPKRLQLNFIERFTGLVLWDWRQKAPSFSWNALIDGLYERFFYQYEGETQKESEDEESLFRKRLNLTDRCIKAGDFLAK